MMLIEDINQILTLHKLIRQRNTGTPEDFAAKLCVSKRKLYYLMDVLKSFGAQIAYSRTNNTFYYNKGFELDVSIKIKNKECEEWKNISGGVSLADKSEFFTRLY